MEILPTDILYSNIHKYLFQYYDNLLNPEVPEEDPEESEEVPEEVPEEPQELPINIKQYLLDHINIIKPIEGRLRLIFSDIDIPDINVLRNVSIDGKIYDIELNDLVTVEKSIEVPFNRPVAQYYLYVMGVFYESKLAPNILITDWMALHLRIYEFFDYFRIVFLTVADNQIPLLDDLESIALPTSLAMLADVNETTNCVSKVGNISSSVIISSTMYTRREIVKLKLLEIAGLKSTIAALEARISALEEK